MRIHLTAAVAAATVALVSMNFSTALAATTGRIAKFVTPTDVGNSVMFEKNGTIGLGTMFPTSKLEISATNALTVRGTQPFMRFRDSSAGNARHVIKSVGGGLNLLSEGFLNGSNPFAFVRIDPAGNVGLGTENPLRALTIGPSPDAAFTIEPSDGSPRAGFIRFGDKTGWRLIIGRSRETSAGPLNSGFTGSLVAIQDNGAFFLSGGFPLGFTGVQPLCRTLANAITYCESSSSSLRYKKDVAAFRGGLDVVHRLHPISFTRKDSGRRSVGLAAEEVESAEPRLAFRNEKGEIEGVRYELLATVFINAFKEQQQQLERQDKMIAELRSAVARLEQAQPLLSHR
jgi:hypothetical protein